MTTATDARSLRAALAGDAPVIRLQPGRYGSRVRVERPVVLEAADPASPPVFSGAGPLLRLTATGPVTLRGLRLLSGLGRKGAGLRIVRGHTRLEDCLLAGHQAVGDGGAVYVAGGAAASLVDCRIEGSRGVGGGAVYAGRDARLELLRCRLLGNGARCGGAVALDAAVATVVACLFAGNRAAHNGAAIAIRRGGSLELRDSVLVGNRGAPAITREDPAPAVDLGELLTWANEPTDAFGVPPLPQSPHPGVIGRGVTAAVPARSAAAQVLGWSSAP